MRTLFTGQTSKEGFYIKYDYVFKLNCVEYIEMVDGMKHQKELDKKTLKKELLHGSKSLTYME